MPFYLPTSLDSAATVTLDGCLYATAEEVLSQYDPNDTVPPEQIKRELFLAAYDAINLRNAAVISKEEKWKYPATIQPLQIALTIAYFCPICCLSGESEDASPDDDPLIMYQDTGDREGLYTLDDTPIDNIIRTFDRSANTRKIKNAAHTGRPPETAINPKVKATGIYPRQMGIPSLSPRPNSFLQSIFSSVYIC